MQDHIEDLSYLSLGYVGGLIVLSAGVLAPLAVMLYRNRKVFTL